MELIAQVTLPSITEVGGWVGAATSSGILGWYLWFTVSRVTPEREKKHDETVQAIVSKHDATVNKLVMDFRTERMAAQADFKATLQSVVDHCEKENSRFIAALERSYPKPPPHGGGS